MYAMNKDLYAYYALKPFIPRSLQIWMRRKVVQKRMQRPEIIQNWPILERAGTAPPNFPGWPGGHEFALVLTHDVEHEKGLYQSNKLADVEQSLGFCSSFNFVPERYNVPSQVRVWLSAHGFEIGVHGLRHDGKLYASEQEFSARAVAINQYLQEWKSVGFRSPAMHRNLEWIGQLNIDYDLSTFDTDPFEPQSDGVETIFPFFVQRANGGQPYVEMPYTLPQDHTLFVIMQERTIDIWKRKVDWIAAHGGMVLVNIHPDYICFDGAPKLEEYSIDLYVELLDYIESKYSGRYWNALPRNVAEYWRAASEDKAQHRSLDGRPQVDPHVESEMVLDVSEEAFSSQIAASYSHTAQTTVSA